MEKTEMTLSGIEKVISLVGFGTICTFLGKALRFFADKQLIRENEQLKQKIAKLEARKAPAIAVGDYERPRIMINRRGWPLFSNEFEP